MKELINFLKDMTSCLFILVGLVGIILIFWHFLGEYQSKQHAHERKMQVVKIEHEKQLAATQKANEVRKNKKRIFGAVLEKAFDIGQKLIGL